MTDKRRIGADDPDLGRDVADAYEKRSVVAAAPVADRLGAALGNVVVAIGLMVGVCVLLGLLWVAVRIVGAL